jgi:hypothetical protein
MADEAVADVVAQDVPASDGAQQQVDTDLELSPEELSEITGQDDAEEELDELEFGFKKYQVPKSLKAGMAEWQKATTTKEQGVSARNKALDERESTIEQRLKATDEELQTRAELSTKKKLLDEYKKLSTDDWNGNRAKNPQLTDEHWTAFQMLKDEVAGLEGKIGEAETSRTKAQSEDLTKRTNATIAFAQKEIPGFGPEQVKKLVMYADSLGIDDTTIQKNWSPEFYKLLHRAHIGEQVLAKASAKKAAPKQETEPLVTVKASGGTAPTGLSDKLSPTEWIKRREAQIAAKNKRA